MSFTYEEQIVSAVNSISQDVHGLAMQKGWWDNPRNDGELLMLIVTELAESCEALRHGNPPDDKIPEFSGAEAELADACIRIFDMAAARGYRLGEAIIAKHKFNATREKMHGGKKF